MRVHLNHVPAQDERHLSGALGGYLNSAERVDEGGQTKAARSLLGSLAEALGILACR